jgi:hypothetical protein
VAHLVRFGVWTTPLRAASSPRSSFSSVRIISRKASIFAALARELLGEHRGRGLGDGASASGEADFFEGIISQVRVDRDVVAAEGVVDVLFDVRVFHFVPVAWTLEVVEDDLFVEALHHLAGDCIRRAGERDREESSMLR